MKGLSKIIGIILGILGLSSKATAKKKAKVKKIDTQVKKVEKEKARVKIAQREQEVKEPEAEQPAPQVPVVDPKAEEWMTKNTWFNSDAVMTGAAVQKHEQLVQQGVDPTSNEYYDEIDKTMREYFPHKFVEDKKPVQTVASAGRKQQGRRTVKLTRSQVAIAKKLGVPLEEYAKHVKE